MSRTVKRHLPSRTVSAAAGQTRAEKEVDLLREQRFANKLYALMTAKKWRQTDLAMAAFGHTIDPKTGYKVAKHRDRISNYINGKQIPDPVNMKLLADALGVSEEELAPDIATEIIEREPAEIQYHQIPGRSDVVFEMKKRLPMEVVHELMGVLIRNKNKIDRLNNPPSTVRDATEDYYGTEDELDGVFDDYRETVR